MTMKDAGHRTAVEAALNHEKYERTPVNNFALVTAARSAGIKVDDARWHPEVSARVAIEYSLKTHSDFVKPVLDSQIPFADLGMKVRFPEDDYGSVKSELVKNAEDIDGLAFFNPAKASECPNFTNVIVKGIEETVKQLEEDLHVCGLSWGPISTAGYLMGTENMLMMTMMGEDETVKKLINKTADFVLAQQLKMIDAGATVMWMADPTSSEDLISPDMFVDLSFGPIKKVIGRTKDQYDVSAFLHICGNTTDILRTLPDTGCDCFSFDHAVDIGKAKKIAGDNIALMGNIDPVSMILQGTPEQITKRCYEMIDVAGQNGGYIIAPGCETPQASPDENVAAMGLAGINYWKYQ
jgi:uroporphyrinogen decarboxylase